MFHLSARAASIVSVTDLSTYVNKTVDFKFMGAELRFDLSHALFSSFDIDLGTRLLLKAVAKDPVLASAKRILDEGCGVGVIGLCVAKAFPEAELTLRDRDSLAVAFAERNRLVNKLRDTTAWKDLATGVERKAKPAPRVEWGLLGDGEEGGPYDFVLSNLPAKAGGPVLASFFSRLSGVHGTPLLVPGGRAGIVIVNPLAESARQWIAEAGLSLALEDRGSGHTAFIVELPSGALSASPSPMAERLGAYHRGESKFRMADLSYKAQGFWGLPEFDTPSFGSSVSAELISRNLKLPSIGDALFIDPGVGHVAQWVSRELGVKRLRAASRDALSLAATAANLESLPARSRPEFLALDALSVADLESESFDLVVENPDVVPERDWIGPSWELAERLVRPGGTYLLCCSPTEMTRFEKRRPVRGAPSGADRPTPLWSLLRQRRKKGFVASAWRRG
jgi:hypothetical protein